MDGCILKVQKRSNNYLNASRLFFLNHGNLFQVDFRTALYNCLVRRLELVAFETESELSANYWTNNKEYQEAMETGSSIFNFFFFHDGIFSLNTEIPTLSQSKLIIFILRNHLFLDEWHTF